MFYLYWTFLLLFLFICAILILLVLIQKGRGGGLSSAFGGGGGGNTAFGAKTGDVLTWATSIVFAVFVILAMVLGRIAEKFDQSQRNAHFTQQTQQAPVQVPAKGQ